MAREQTRGRAAPRSPADRRSSAATEPSTDPRLRGQLLAKNLEVAQAKQRIGQLERRQAGMAKALKRLRSERALTREFYRLLGEWQAQSAHMSMVRQKTELPVYHELLRLGPRLVPLILNELEREPSHLLCALWDLTGEDPVPPEARGRLREMARAWVDWGRERGLLTP